MNSQVDGWPDTEEVLARFREWFAETREEVESVDSDALDSGLPSIGLYQLVEQLTSLRHEVKLLTKAARSGEERGEATLLSMQAAIEQFQRVQESDSEVTGRAARPLVDGLVDLDESLRRGRRAIENAQQRMDAELSTSLATARDRFERLYRAQAWWRRAICQRWHAAATAIFDDHVLNSQRAVLQSLLEGFDLTVKRLQTTLDQQSIIRMQCVGRQVDPHSMTVVETISDPALPVGQVVEEIRTGYYWKTDVFRFAEVKAVGER